MRKKYMSARRLLRTHANFSQSLMVLEYQNLDALNWHLWTPERRLTDSITEMFSCKNLLPAIRRVYGNMFTFQQDSTCLRTVYRRSRRSIPRVGR